MYSHKFCATKELSQRLIEIEVIDLRNVISRGVWNKILFSDLGGLRGSWSLARSTAREGIARWWKNCCGDYRQESLSFSRNTSSFWLRTHATLRDRLSVLITSFSVLSFLISLSRYLHRCIKWTWHYSELVTWRYCFNSTEAFRPKNRMSITSVLTSTWSQRE